MYASLIDDKNFKDWLDQKREELSQTEWNKLIRTIPYAEILYQGFSYYGYTPNADGCVVFVSSNEDDSIMKAIAESDHAKQALEILEEFTKYIAKNSPEEIEVGSWNNKRIYQKIFNDASDFVESVKRNDASI